MIDWFTLDNWFAFSATFAGSLFGVTQAKDFPVLELRRKAWRMAMAFLIAFFTGPFILTRLLGEVDQAAAGFGMFVLSASALYGGPVVIRRVVTFVQRVRVGPLPEDDQ